MFKRPSVSLSKDETRKNLEDLIELYTTYRQMQYDIFKQFDKLLEDPRFDTMYVSIEPLEHYRSYVEDDLNGTQNHSSTTAIIKEFKSLLSTYDTATTASESNKEHIYG